MAPPRDPVIPAHPTASMAGTYSDDVIRAMIAYIVAHHPTPFVRRMISDQYGANGENWPQGMAPNASRAGQAANIVNLYLQSLGQGPPLLPPEDPGAAQAGIGPPSQLIPGLPQIKSVVDFLNLLTRPEFWVRAAEFTIGILLIGVGVNAVMKQQGGPDAGSIARTAGKVMK